MKQIALMIIVVLIGGITNQSFAQKKGREVVCFQSNMDCVDCEKSLYDHLRFEKGVKDLKIDHVSNTILIEYLNKKNDSKSLAGAIEKKGYKAEKIDRKTYDKKIAHAKEHGHEHHNEVHKER
ncbi:MAG TPA: cation transporter [Mariniphaga sp.]|nr:cation transporter [Mariniphaga sp.]